MHCDNILRSIDVAKEICNSRHDGTNTTKKLVNRIGRSKTVSLGNIDRYILRMTLTDDDFVRNIDLEELRVVKNDMKLNLCHDVPTNSDSETVEKPKLREKPKIELMRLKSHSTGSIPTGPGLPKRHILGMGLLIEAHRMKYEKTRCESPVFSHSEHSSGTILEIPSSEKSIDWVLQEINPFGRFQQVLVLLLFLGAAPIIGFQEFVLVTQSIIPKWSCAGASSVECAQLTASYTYSPNHPNTTKILCSLDRDQWCWDNMLYNSVSQWDIPCSKGKVILEMVYRVPGGITGCFLVAKLCDKMGRRLSFLVFLIASLTVGTMISSAKYFIAYLIFRMLVGLSITGLHIVNYIWILEHFSHSRRGIANAGFDTARLLFVPLLALLNSRFKSWNFLHLTSTITLLLGVFVFFKVPESPRWFILKGDVSKAENILKHIAPINKEQYPLRMALVYKQPDDRLSEWYRRKYILMIWLWTNTFIAYHCIKASVVPFVNDVNVSESIYSLLGIPLIILTGVILVETVGRRATVILLVILSLLCCGLIIIPTNMTSTLSTSQFIPIGATYFIYPSISSVLTLWAVELSPTFHRVQIFCLLMAIRCVIDAILPVSLPSINSQYKHTSIIISIILLILNIVLATFLLDTKGRDMAEIPSSEDADETHALQLLKKAISNTRNAIINTRHAIKSTQIMNNTSTNNNYAKNKNNIQAWRPLSPILF